MALTGWSTGREFTFPAVAESSAGVQCDLLLSADNFAAGFTAAQSDGGDLRVTDASDNLLPFYLHFFDQTNSIALITILTPLRSTEATSVWVWTGNAAATSVSSTDDTYHKAARGSGVLAAYDFDETSGSTVVDKVGSADMTLTGSPTRVDVTDMRVGRGVDDSDPAFVSGNGYVTFDGSTQYGTAPGAMPDAMAEGAISFDYKCEDSTTNNGRRVITKVNNGGSRGIDIFIGPNALSCRLLTASGAVSLATNSKGQPIAHKPYNSTSFIDGNIYHCVFTWGSRGMEWWVDGQLMASNSTTLGYEGATRDLTIGAYNYQSPPQNLAACTIGSLAVWDHQPTQREILAAMMRRSVVAESDTQLTKAPSSGAWVSPTLTAHDGGVYEPKYIAPQDGPDGNHHLFFSAGFGQDGSSTWYATSDDGETWTLPYSTPIVGQGYGGMSGIAVRNNTYWDATNSQWVMIVSENVSGANHGLRRLTNPNTPPDAASWVLDSEIVVENGATTSIGFPTNSRWFTEDDGTELLTFDHSTDPTPPVWTASQATGSSRLGSFTVLPDSHDALKSLQVGDNDGIYSTIAILKHGGVYYGFGHAGVYGAAPTECYAYVAGNPRGPWYKRYGSMPYARLDDATSVGSDRDQTADPIAPVQVGDEVWVIYDLGDNTGDLEFVIKRGVFEGTLAEFLADSPTPTAGAIYPARTMSLALVRRVAAIGNVHIDFGGLT